MGFSHRHVVAVIAVLVLSGCTTASGNGTAPSTPMPGTSQTGVPTGSPEPAPATTPPTATPSAPAPAPSGEAPPTKVSVDPTPLPKVQRSGGASKPTATAEPADTTDKVVYSDGVTLRISGIEFGEETKEGPGRFPGRQYAILALEIVNSGAEPINLDTTVVTVLDKNDQLVAPVYVEEADVSDFSGQVAAGGSNTARYAFAVPKASRSQVTVVVDFDNVHTSAVFSGELN
ncbi:DUF4352 domain-containing protein [Tessaracoccus sp. HDW20]|uniref:DUF4352 domain-containing protein n=1 Tax=Tessaracoccus coleopterorum TaxID=2714950 RepID=UPI0018D3D2EF|nr:DUF4352 domain-containing protein [Tessaracoccus coleopterorum]NHB84231.1 DUF4352 domain-containing protein [Tessaracoccus coleopterorum]